jgi:hypothetical protein
MGSLPLAQQTPGDPPEPTGGEPTIMAFRRPADRPVSGQAARSQTAVSPSSVAPDALPIVLKLPDLTRGQILPLPVTPIASTRSWIGIAMWCVTGVLAVVAAVLIFTGKPESAVLPVDEAPAWRTDATEAAVTNHSPSVGNAGRGFPSAQSVGGAAAASPVDRASPQGAEGWSATPTNDGARTGASPAGGPPPASAPRGTDGFPGDAFPRESIPGATAPGGTGSGGTGAGGPGAGGAGPVGGPYPPPVAPNGSAGFGDSEAQNAPPDQSKHQTSLRTATQPGTTGGARLDGIRNLDVSPRYDSSR